MKEWIRYACVVATAAMISTIIHGCRIDDQNSRIKALEKGQPK